MTNESEGVDELADVADIEPDDSTDWQAEHKKVVEKVIRTRERNKMIRDENKTLKSELEIFKKASQGVPPQDQKDSKKSDEIDFGKLSLHNFKDNTVKVVHDDDIEYLKGWMKDSGKSQDEILNLQSFQAEMRARQEARTVVNAMPSTTRRSGEQGNQLEVEYTKYLQTGRLPQDLEMRIAVVNKRQQREQMANSMTSQPVVEN